MAAGEGEVVICAPFVKRRALLYVLEDLNPLAKLTVFTRWRVEEIAAGVSDPQIVDDVIALGGTVELCDRLHAKYFRADDRILIGSANVTATALQNGSNGNLEILSVPNNRQELRAEFEPVLEASSYTASIRLAQDLIEMAAEICVPPSETALSEVRSEPPDGEWFPRLRQPADLYTAYLRGSEALSTQSALAADGDLRALDLPVGMTPDAFATLVGSRLLAMPLVQQLERDLENGTLRFGAVKDLISSATGVDAGHATTMWQTLMRWLLEFLPGRYAIETPRHSEIIRRVS